LAHCSLNFNEGFPPNLCSAPSCAIVAAIFIKPLEYIYVF
jgi:hypothetical protein